MKNPLRDSVNSILAKKDKINLGSFGNQVLADINISTEMSQYATKLAVGGSNKTDGGTPLRLTGRKGELEQPGFTPPNINGGNWYGDIIDNSKKIQLTTKDRFALTTDIMTNVDKDSPRSMRDSLFIFNDITTDYFKYGYQVLNMKNIPNSQDSSSIFTTNNAAVSDYKSMETPLENNDPPLYGFDIIFDVVSSPLLNGAVEDFIEQYKGITEISTRKYIISEFKKQFKKLFKTNAELPIDNDSALDGIVFNSNDYSNIDGPNTNFSNGKTAYMSYYLKKIDGLNNLIESNESDKKKYLTSYKTDNIKLSFYEDISLTLGSLAFLYKMLYWSKPNGKGLIPENLLRFNCDIIISDMRNMRRVVRGVKNGDLSVVADNLSRYVFSLKECQFYFNKMPFDDAIDVSSNPKVYDNYEIEMDYKYVTSRFDRWRPDKKLYTSFNNGSLWKLGNKGTTKDILNNSDGKSFANAVNISTPKCYTSGTNTLNQNNIKKQYTLQNYNNDYIERDDVSHDDAEYGKGQTVSKILESVGGSASLTTAENGKHSNSMLNDFKKNDKSSYKNLIKNLAFATATEISIQANMRLKKMDTLINNYIQIKKMREPTNVYDMNYLQNLMGGNVSSLFTNMVENSVRDFAGDMVGGALGKFIKNGNTNIFE